MFKEVTRGLHFSAITAPVLQLPRDYTNPDLSSDDYKVPGTLISSHLAKLNVVSSIKLPLSNQLYNGLKQTAVAQRTLLPGKHLDLISDLQF